MQSSPFKKLRHFRYDNKGSTGARLKVIGNYDLIFKKSQQFYFGIGYEFISLFQEGEFLNGFFVKNDLAGLFNTNVGYRLHNLRLELGYEAEMTDFKAYFINFTIAYYLRNSASKKQ